LLVENTPVSRARLQRALAANGFAAVAAVSTQAALAAAYNAEFAYAVVEMEFRDGKGLDLVRKLRQHQAGMRIVVITDHDSFATVILALRAGADDYLPMPVSEHELTDALLGRRPALPPVPETPLAIQRIRWEHTQRILEQCGRNVSDAARRLRMHRRSLQRMLNKRAPYSRGSLQS
jgi:two-component system response regulator RegA